MPKLPSPCIGVCKFRRPGPAGEHCIGCSMTKAQKKVGKKAAKAGRAEGAGFVALVAAQQAQMGRYAHWRAAYLKRCLKRGVAAPDAVRRIG